MVCFKLSCFGVKKKQRLLFIETIERLCKRLDAHGHIITFNERRGRKRSYFDVSIMLENEIPNTSLIIRTRQKFVRYMNCEELELYLNLYTIYKNALFIKDVYIDLSYRRNYRHEEYDVQD